MRPRINALLPILAALGACLPATPNPDGGSITFGSPCDVGAEFDVCSPKGYVCTSGDAGTATCGYPEANGACLPSTGCDPNAAKLACYGFSADGGPEALAFFCGTPCTHPTDCIDSTASCYEAFADGGRVGACLTNYCDTPDTPCAVSDGGPEGTCFADGEFGDTVCHQSGPVATNDPCSGETIDGGAYLCEQNDFCGVGSSSGLTACLASCSGGPGCPSDQSCVSYYALCLTPCSQGSTSCPSPYTCIKLLGAGGSSLGYYCFLP